MEFDITCKELIDTLHAILTRVLAVKLAGIGLENSLENRQSLRELLFTTSNIEEFISGVVSKRFYRLQPVAKLEYPLLTYMCRCRSFSRKRCIRTQKMAPHL